MPVMEKIVPISYKLIIASMQRRPQMQMVKGAASLHNDSVYEPDDVAADIPQFDLMEPETVTVTSISNS